ncbi:MAG: hypothetical protein M0Z99_32025 [Betaproteobacteria bacterium]|nr:hypothetical protein [Betaproteobacteria bacterium]
MWKQQIPGWIPLAGLVTGKLYAPFLTKVIELLIVGVISSVITLNTLANDIANLKIQFVTNEKQNADYREKTAREKTDDDKKWDARISRLENCFISRMCGLTK